MHLVVDPGQVGDGGALTDSAELVVDGTVTEADPALVGTQVGHGDATQMRADGRAADNAGVAGVGNGGLRLLIELSGGWQGVGLVDLGLGQSTHEDHLSVPGSLGDLTWRKLRDVHLLVSVTDVTITGDHLVVDNSQDGLDTEHVVSEDEALEHVDLSATDFVVTVLFVLNSANISQIV